MQRAVVVILSIAASAAMLLLALPPADQHYLAWFALAPVLAASRGLGFGVGFICGLASGLFAAVLCTQNLFYPARLTEGNDGWTYLGLSLFGVIIGLIVGVFAEQRTLNQRVVFAIASLAVLLEASSMVLLPANIAITQYRSDVWLAVSSVMGIWSVSFAIWFVNLELAIALADKLRSVAIAVFMFAVLVAGLGFIRFPKDEITTPIHLACIQGTDLYVDKLKERNLAAGKRGAEIVVWPELSGSGAAINGDTTTLRNVAKEPGQPAFVTTFEDGSLPKPFNVAAIFSAEGESDRYAKRKLFGGETSVHASGDKEVAVGKFGLNICFDSCYPHVMRETANLPGVQVILLPSLDPAAPNGFTQAAHAAYTPFRAAELGMPIARADTSGYSMIVDGRGRIVAMAGLGERVIDAVVDATPRTTLYRRFDDFFLYECGFLVLFAIWKARRQPPRGG